MFELLEDLPPKFRDRYKKEVGMMEITRYSLNIHSSAAIVVTNNKLYLYSRKLLFTKVWKEELKNIFYLEISGDKLKIYGETGKKELKLASEKVSAVKKLIKELNEILNKP